MTALIDSLFNKSQSDAIRKLWEDKDSRRLIQKEIGKTLLAKDQIVPQLPLTQLMFIISLSDFADSDKECVNVAEIVYWGINTVDIIPMISEHHGKDLAYRCLVSLGLFKEYMISRSERRGSPSISFYRAVGVKTFNDIGMGDISNHFSKWEGFLGEFLI